MSTKLSFIIVLFALLDLGCAKSDPESTNNRYIVVFKKAPVGVAARSNRITSAKAVEKVMGNLASRHALKLAKRTFSVALHAGVFELDEDQLKALANDPDVDYIEKDEIVSINTAQSGATWGLDRIDQTDLPLDLTYNYQDASNEVNAYVIDTGINTAHADFQGRAVSGIDTVDNDSDATDCNGHGTHVAGTIGSATFGVSKTVKLHGVRVLDCFGFGNYSDVIAGIEWVTANHVKPAVANMSLGGPVSQAIDDAVNASIAAGVTFVVAAGNESRNACNGSPSRVPAAITVGSTDNTDNRSWFSNYGPCVDIFAPGSDVTSLWFNSTTATETISGTSMAAPHVAGVVALYLAQHPLALPQEVATAVVAGAGSDKVKTPGTGSPNKLLNTAFILRDDNGGGGGYEEDGDDQGSSDSQLTNDVAITGLSGARGHELAYTLKVPAGATGLVIEISGGQGDADLYVKAGARPTLESYDCRPYRSGNAEKCSVASPVAGIYHVVLRGYSAFSAVTLIASYQPAECSGAYELRRKLP